MTAYIVRRFLLVIPVLLGVTSLTYAAMAAAAGNYVPGLDMNTNMRPEDVERLRRSLGLDLPLYVQYLSWLGAVSRGDFGRSMIDGTPVAADILARLPNTILLTSTALCLGGLLGIIVGVISALNRGRFPDKVLSIIAVAGFAIPQFWLGVMLIMIFAVGFQGWGLPSLPAGGASDPFAGGDLLDRARHLILPALTLSFVYVSTWSRFVRSSMLDVLSQEYIRTARAKGLKERHIVYRHALPNAVMPLITLVGLEVPRLISGALVVEVIYSWPGIGRLAFDRAFAFDYTAVMGITTFVAMMVAFGSLIADLAYGVVDPRIRYG